MRSHFLKASHLKSIVQKLGRQYTLVTMRMRRLGPEELNSKYEKLAEEEASKTRMEVLMKTGRII